MRLSAREGGRLLPHLDVAEPDAHQRIHLLSYARYGLEKALGVFNGHVQHIGDAFAFVLNFKRFPVVAGAVARLTGYIHIRQKVHFNLDHAIALTGLTSPTFDVEAEAPGLVATRFRLWQPGKPIPNGSEGARIGRRVRTWRAPDWTLVDIDHLIEMLQPFDGFTRRWRLPRPIQTHRRRFEERFDRQSRFSAARHAGDADKLPQREIHCHILQIVTRSFNNGQLLLVSLAPFLRNCDFTPPRKIVARNAGGVLCHGARRAMRHHHAPMHTSPRANVKNVVSLADRLFVMFDNNHGIALITQVLERAQQAVIVALMQTDRRLVQHVQHSGKPRTDLRRQTYPLAFPTAERSG